MKELKVGTVGKLKFVRFTDFGGYVGYEDDETAVLLPGKEVPEGAKCGDSVKVFLYRDSEGRKIATTRTPYVFLNEFAVLPVKSVTKLGSFLDFGLERDLFLPYKETEGMIRAGDFVPVMMYTDKSGRLAATMKIYDYLSAESDYRKGESFYGIVYKNVPEIGALTAVFPKEDSEKNAPGEKVFSARIVPHVKKLYFGLIPAQNVLKPYRPGDFVSGRIARVRGDGKLDLSLTASAKNQIKEDAERIVSVIKSYDGVLPFSESANPEIVKRELEMSKNRFKNALGHLLKQKKIEIGEKEVRLI